MLTSSLDSNVRDSITDVRIIITYLMIENVNGYKTLRYTQEKIRAGSKLLWEGIYIVWEIVGIKHRINIIFRKTPSNSQWWKC